MRTCPRDGRNCFSHDCATKECIGEHIGVPIVTVPERRKPISNKQLFRAIQEHHNDTFTLD